MRYCIGDVLPHGERVESLTDLASSGMKFGAENKLHVQLSPAVMGW